MSLGPSFGPWPGYSWATSSNVRARVWATDQTIWPDVADNRLWPKRQQKKGNTKNCLIIVRRVAEVEQINFFRFNYSSFRYSLLVYFFPVRHTSCYNLRAINSPSVKVRMWLAQNGYTLASCFNYLNEFTFVSWFSFLTLSFGKNPVNHAHHRDLNCLVLKDLLLERS